MNVEKICALYWILIARLLENSFERRSVRAIKKNAVPFTSYDWGSFV